MSKSMIVIDLGVRTLNRREMNPVSYNALSVLRLG